MGDIGVGVFRLVTLMAWVIDIALMVWVIYRCGCFSVGYIDGMGDMVDITLMVWVILGVDDTRCGQL